VIPIPGTKRVASLEENAGSTAGERAADDLARRDAVTAVGDRAVDPGWIYRETPLPSA
jgi:hypothetical protein